MVNMVYPICIESHDNCHEVHAKDIDSFTLIGTDIKETLSIMERCILMELNYQIEEKAPITIPEPDAKYNLCIYLPHDVALRIVLWNRLIDNNITITTAAKNSSTSVSRLKRSFNLEKIGYAGRIKNLVNYLDSLGVLSKEELLEE